MPGSFWGVIGVKVFQESCDSELWLFRIRGVDVAHGKGLAGNIFWRPVAHHQELAPQEAPFVFILDSRLEAFPLFVEPIRDLIRWNDLKIRIPFEGGPEGLREDGTDLVLPELAEEVFRQLLTLLTRLLQDRVVLVHRTNLPTQVMLKILPQYQILEQV